jgi:hypothetical protein
MEKTNRFPLPLLRFILSFAPDYSVRTVKDGYVRRPFLFASAFEMALLTGLATVRLLTSLPLRPSSHRRSLALSRSRTSSVFLLSSSPAHPLPVNSLDLPSSTASITLNAAAPLKLLNAVLVQSPNGKRIPVERTEENEEDELVTLHLQKKAEEGEAVLAVRFEGRLDEGALLGTLLFFAPTSSSCSTQLPFPFDRLLPHRCTIGRRRSSSLLRCDPIPAHFRSQGFRTLPFFAPVRT